MSSRGNQKLIRIFILVNWSFKKITKFKRIKNQSFAHSLFVISSYIFFELCVVASHWLLVEAKEVVVFVCSWCFDRCFHRFLLVFDRFVDGFLTELSWRRFFFFWRWWWQFLRRYMGNKFPERIYEKNIIIIINIIIIYYY